MKKLLIISLLSILGIVFLSAIYVFAKPIQDKVSSTLNEKTEWTSIGQTEVVYTDNDGNIRDHYNRELFVKVINDQFFYRIEDGYDCYYSISKNRNDLEYNASYLNYKLNVPHW